MILSQTEIKRHIELGLIKISENVGELKINTNSIDLTMHPEILVYNGNIIDMKKGENNDNCFEKVVVGESGYLINRGSFFLCRTNEITTVQNSVPIIFGKSSVARGGLDVTSGAGYGDVGFSGAWTLCVSSNTNVIVYPNMPLCQMSIHALYGEIGDTYNKVGRYNNNGSILTSKGV